VSDGKILEDSIPVFVVTFSTQEVLMFRNAVSREVVVGAENRVEQCVYAAVITRIAEEMSDEITGGWKVVEVMSLSYMCPPYAYCVLLRFGWSQMARRSARAYL
jgi:hypothetical protein